jgi:hypothetical protein
VYGVAIDPETRTVIDAETAELRGPASAAGRPDPPAPVPRA